QGRTEGMSQHLLALPRGDDSNTLEIPGNLARPAAGHSFEGYKNTQDPTLVFEPEALESGCRVIGLGVCRQLSFNLGALYGHRPGEFLPLLVIDFRNVEQATGERV